MNLVDKSSRIDQSSQPAGVPAHGSTRGGSSKAASADQLVLDLHARLCELVADPQERADLLRVPVSVDAAWLAGRMLPVLRAQRKALQTAVDRLERADSAR